MTQWFRKTFLTTKWWEIGLCNVAKKLGLEVIDDSCYYAHRAAERHCNWRFMHGWLTISALDQPV